LYINNARKNAVFFFIILSLYFFLVSTPSYAVTVSRIPGTIVNSAGVGTISWGTPQNANVSDNSYATAAVTGATQSNYLNASNFGFNIPIGSTIHGIEVRIERSGSSNNRARDAILRLMKGGVISGNDYAITGTRWGTTDTTITYGGLTDTWGLNWTALDINNLNFGLVFSVDASNTVTARVDHLNVTINYTEPTENIMLYVNPTPTNNSVIYDNYAFINISTNFNPDTCQLNWSGTTYTMNGAGINWYYNVTSISPGNYQYYTRCNDTLGWTNTTIRNITVAVFPTISYVSPTYPNSWSSLDNRAYVNTTVSGSDIGSSLIDWNYTLVLWLRLNNESEETTSFFKDSSTYMNNATCGGTGCPAYSTGKLGKALTFDRINDEINVTNSNSLNPSTGITISAWFKINGSSGTNRYIISKPTGATWTAPYATYAIRLTTSNNIEFWINDGSNPANIVTSTSTYNPDNIWRHMVATFNGTTQRVYVNGQIQGTNDITTTISSSAQPLYIGTTGRTTTERWNGSLDDIQIHARAFSDSEVNASYDASSYRLYRNFTGLSVGDYYYTAYIQDLFGANTFTETRLFTVTATPPDNTNPNITLLSPQDGTNTQNITNLFSCNISDNVEVYNLSLYIWNSTGSRVNEGNLWCYQEFADVSTDCGGLNNGTYSVTGSWTNAANAYDGSWSTSATGGSSPSNYIYVTYYKPLNALNSSLWQVRDSQSTRNLTIINTCWSQSTLQFRIQGSSSSNLVSWQCYTGATWQTISTFTGSNLAFEEAMYWDIDVSTTNAFLGGQYNQSSWNFTFPYFGDFYWNCLGYDTSNNDAFASANYSITILPQDVPPAISSMSITDFFAPEEQLILLAGGTRNISCLVTTMDYNGVSSITNASATLYYYLNKSSDPDNGNVHYTNANCSLNQTTATNKTFSCDFQVYYYANNGTWNCSAIVRDSTNLNGTDSNNTLINQLYALNITDGIGFGNVEPNNESAEITANITNIGNMPINLTLQGYAIFIGDNNGMNCSDGTNVSIDRIKYSLVTSTYNSKDSLTGGLQQLTLMMPKPTSLTPVSNTTYWQIMPDPYVGSVSRYCSGYIIFSAESS